MIYDRNCPRLDRSQKLSSLFDPYLWPIAESIVAKAGKRRKKDAVENVKTALSVILFNLLRAHALHPSRCVQIYLGNNGYKKGQFNPYQLGIRAVRKVVDYLTGSTPSLAYKRGGNFGVELGKGYTTIVMASDSLITSIDDYINKSICNEYIPINRNTFETNKYIAIRDIAFDRANLPIIRLRKGSSKDGSEFEEFQHTTETLAMEASLHRYNSFISDIRLNLFVSEKEMASLADQTKSGFDEFGRPSSASPLIDLVSGKSLHRIFNYRRFDQGGRFYGGFWQNVPKAYRRFITINGMPTVEVDFSNMQLAMLYAKVGQQLEGDAYILDGFGQEFRDLVKTTTLKMINAQGHIEAPLRSKLPEGVSWKDLQEAVLAKHKPIAKFFRSGEGIRLQRQDSDIAEDVIMTMMDTGVPVLPVHDSFIVTEGYADELSATMLDAYRQRMGGWTISLKHSRSLFDDLLADQEELHGDERHSLGMKLFLAKREAPEYEGYRLREKLLGHAKTDSSGKNTEIRLGDRTGNAPDEPIPEIGPSAGTAYSGGNWLLDSAKRLWDRFVA
ncbi:hypothetical protein [Mesorhizobium sp. WSM4904]|uniref:hypothetical protein n=1 Tax=Mesorhizobium sp. WSM4904 TaxID=3038545 RepID=UPI00241840F6|nr:hypothetical protein [Mesorhizobium sp. WSM4904]WFP65110.1 hypothetical protein QAZ47_11545 [Mesorhizobium sp. WSM4904]